MSFILFLAYYFLATLIFFVAFLIIYKLFLKNFLINYTTEKALTKVFDDFPNKSILDIETPKEEDNKNEKIPTYF